MRGSRKSDLPEENSDRKDTSVGEENSFPCLAGLSSTKAYPRIILHFLSNKSQGTTIGEMGVKVEIRIS